MKGKEARIVFMGTPEFAVASLDALLSNGYQVVGVVTAPDKPAGRGRRLTQSAVGEYSAAKGIKVLKPEKMKDPVFLGELKSLNADIQAVVAFRMLPEVVWSMPPLGTFNLHASLLPHYRGAAPVNWALINGEKKTGMTTFLLDHQIDTGKIIFREEMSVGENETAGELHDRLMVSGANLVIRTVDAMAEGDVTVLDQGEIESGTGELKPAPKIFRDDCRIGWNKNAETIRNLVRGLSPCPAAWTILLNERDNSETVLKIYLAAKENEIHSCKPGTIISDHKTYMKIACADGWIIPIDLQSEGRKRMKSDEFLRGFQGIEDYFAV